MREEARADNCSNWHWYYCTVPVWHNFDSSPNLLDCKGGPNFMWQCCLKSSQVRLKWSRSSFKNQNWASPSRRKYARPTRSSCDIRWWRKKCLHRLIIQLRGSDKPSNRGKSIFEYMKTNGRVPPVPLVVRGPWARESGDPWFSLLSLLFLEMWRASSPSRLCRSCWQNSCSSLWALNRLRRLVICCWKCLKIAHNACL